MRKEAAAVVALVLWTAAASAEWKLPKLPPADQYGTFLLDRIAGNKGEKGVVFSHWLHRRRYACRVCHTELGFAMKVGATPVTEARSSGGRYCGAPGCHDGRTAFGHDAKSCGRCHTGTTASGRQRFRELDDFPHSRFGDGIDWAQAQREGRIRPLTFLNEVPKPLSMDRTIRSESRWDYVPPSTFPHREHTALLDCSSCHPEPFAVQKSGTLDMSMQGIVDGEYCGMCHLTVAFPMNDCRRCHPGIKEWQ